MFPLLYVPPPPTPLAPCQGPPPFPPLTLGALQLLNSLESLGFDDGIPLSNILGEVYMVVDLLDTLQLVVLNSND